MVAFRVRAKEKNKYIYLAFLSVFTTFDLAVQITHVRKNSNIIWFFAHLIVILQSYCFD